VGSGERNHPMNSQEEVELIWYYNYSEADCGIKSNYMSMINCSLFGPPTGSTLPYNEFIFQAVDRRREISTKLNKLSEINQKVLFATYGANLDSEIVSYFHNLAGAVYCYPKAKPEELKQLIHRHNMGTIKNEEIVILADARFWANTNLIDSMNNYRRLSNDE
jgi:hypothetical protein